MSMPMRQLGKDGPKVSAIGLGCMGLSAFYGRPTDQAEAIKLLNDAIKLGVNFFDTAEVYGANQELLGEAFKSVPRESIIIATKFGFKDGDLLKGTDSSPAGVRKMVEEALTNLQTNYIDILYQHSVDPAVPMEVVAQTVKELIAEGKVKYFGLSGATADEIRRAHAVCPVTCLQSEYSLWFRPLEKDVIPVLKELGIALVPYSPLGRGFLTGKVDATTKFGEGDFRGMLPRFSEENIKGNLAIVDLIKIFAERKGATPAQIALAWILAQDPSFVPIPGTTKLHRLEENLASVKITFTPEELKEINEASDKVEIVGTQYPATMTGFKGNKPK